MGRNVRQWGLGYAFEPSTENGFQQRPTDYDVSPWTWALPVSLPIGAAGWVSDARDQHNGMISPADSNALVRDDIAAVLNGLAQEK